MAFLSGECYLLEGFLEGMGFKKTSVPGMDSAYEFHLVPDDETRGVL